MARTLFYIVDFIRFNHFPHLISLFNIFSKNMVGRDPLELLLTDKLCVKIICWDCTFHSLVVQFSTIYSTAALMQLQVGPVHTSAQPWGSFSFQFCQEPLPCWQPGRLGFSFFLSLLFTAKMWRLVINLLLYIIPSTYQYSLVVNAGEEVRGKLAAD